MYKIVFSSQQPKAKDFRKHCFKLTNKIKEEHQQAIEEKDNQIQAHQHKILKLNEEIDDLIKTDTYPVVDILTMCCASLKRIAKRFIRITLFEVNIDSSKNIRNVLNFVTQTWRRLTGAMIQMLFIDGTYSRVR